MSTPKPGREVRNIDRRDDYFQPLTTYAATIPGHSWSFSGEAGCFLTESAFYSWSIVFSQHVILSLHLTPGLQCAIWYVQFALTLTGITSKKLTL